MEAAEAKDRFGTVLADVARGRSVTITERGVPVAQVVPLPQPFDRTQARAAAAGLKALSRRLTLGGLSMREMIEDGRA